MSDNFIFIGFLLFVLVLLPVILIRDYRQKRKVRQILEAHRKQNVGVTPGPGTRQAKQEVAPEGWGMNNSPFRNRKSGLRWGGGNIKASEASRRERRKFL